MARVGKTIFTEEFLEDMKTEIMDYPCYDCRGPKSKSCHVYCKIYNIWLKLKWREEIGILTGKRR